MPCSFPLARILLAEAPQVTELGTLHYNNGVYCIAIVAIFRVHQTARRDMLLSFSRYV